MRYLKVFYLLIGVALLAAVIAEIEVAEVGVQIGPRHHSGCPRQGGLGR